MYINRSYINSVLYIEINLKKTLCTFGTSTITLIKIYSVHGNTYITETCNNVVIIRREEILRDLGSVTKLTGQFFQINETIPIEGKSIQKRTEIVQEDGHSGGD